MRHRKNRAHDEVVQERKGKKPTDDTVLNRVVAADVDDGGSVGIGGRPTAALGRVQQANRVSELRSAALFLGQL